MCVWEERFVDLLVRSEIGKVRGVVRVPGLG